MVFTCHRGSDSFHVVLAKPHSWQDGKMTADEPLEFYKLNLIISFCKLCVEAKSGILSGSGWRSYRVDFDASVIKRLCTNCCMTICTAHIICSTMHVANGNSSPVFCRCTESIDELADRFFLDRQSDPLSRQPWGEQEPLLPSYVFAA